MLGTRVDSIIRERARIARDDEYIKQDLKDNLIDSILESAEDDYVKESYNELLEAADAVERLSPDDSVAEERELNNILEATSDLTFEEMIDLDMLLERAMF